jgi:hypothetical protein
MATTLADQAVRRAFRPSFYFWMTVVMALFVFAGFGMTYWQPMASGTLAPLPPMVHLHGFIFSTWMLLLIVQSLLVNTRNIPLHRSVGTFGITVATGVIFTGALLTLMFGHFALSDPPPDYYNLMYLGVMAVLGFGFLFCLAIRNVRRPEYHRRLILLATVPLLPPGINRLYMMSFHLELLPVLATYLTMDALVAAVLIHDWRTTGKAHRASLVGAGFVLLQQVLHVPVAGSDAFTGFCRMLTDLVYYR